MEDPREQKENFDCPICFDIFSESKTPLMLPCNHSFCSDCLKRLYGDHETVTCALCRQVTSSPLNALPIAYSLLSPVIEEPSTNQQYDASEIIEDPVLAPENFVHLQLSKQLDIVIGFLRRLPSNSYSKELERNLTLMRSLLCQKRNPRIVLVGRRGAGKTSFIRALLDIPLDLQFKEVSDTVLSKALQEFLRLGDIAAATGVCSWATIKGIDIMDTRGCQDDVVQLREADAATPLESFEISLNRGNIYPDVIVFVAKATEVSAAMDGDIKYLTGVTSIVNNIRNRNGLPNIGVISLLSKIDEVAPSQQKDWKVIFSDNARGSALKKRENILAAAEILRVKSNAFKVIPICANMESEGDDLRYNVDYLRKYLQTGLPLEAQVNFAFTIPSSKARKAIAKQIVNAFSALAGTVAAIPSLPFQDIVFISGVQLAMISAISELSNHSTPDKTVKGFIVSLVALGGIAILGREVVRNIVRAVPGVGWVASKGIASTATYQLGLAAIKFFLD